MNSKELELAWAAGFWDGEGTARHVNSGGYHAKVGQADRETLDRFQAAVEIGAVHGPYKNGDNCPMFDWGVSNYADMKVLYDKLVPYLSSIKAAQLELALSYYVEPPVPKTREQKNAENVTRGQNRRREAQLAIQALRDKKRELV